MKIVVVCDVLGEPNNGTSIAAYNLINVLKSKGHTVKVICPDEIYRGKEGFYIVPTYDFGKIINNYIKKNDISIGKPEFSILDDACHDADIIHGMLPFGLSRAACRYAKAHNIPFSMGFHCQAENVMSHFYLMNIPLANRITYKNFWKGLYKDCYSVHYPTEFIKDYVKKFGIKVPHEYVISNGVNKQFVPTFFERPENLKDKFVILMTGRLSREKNQTMLIKAVGKSKYNEKIQLVFAGGGPLERRLRRRSNRYLKNAAIFQTFSRDELVKYLSWCNLYVHTSKIEIEAISCLEAIASGKVPLISDSPRSATSKFSLFPESSFKYNSKRDLTKKIDWWIEHPEKIKEVAPRYAEFGRQFDYDSCMDRMEKMLVEVYQIHEREKESR